MKERMQKPLSQVNGCPQRNRSETEWYGGVQTFMWMCEDNIVEVPFDKEPLFEQILSPTNLNRAYKAVMRNKGCGGIDKMSCEQLLPWLLTNKDELIRSLRGRVKTPNINNKKLVVRSCVDVQRVFVFLRKRALQTIYMALYGSNKYSNKRKVLPWSFLPPFS